MRQDQTKAVALAAISVVALVVGTALFGGADEPESTAVAASSSVENTLPLPPTLAPTTVAPTTIAPTTISATTIPPPPDAGCAETGPSAAIDRDAQRAWLCLDGYITTEFAVSTAWSLPDPGEYQVFAKDRVTTSTFGGHVSTLKNFVAFTLGENTGARVAFHSIPVLSDGSLIQPIDSVGDLARRGESSGCIRVLPEISRLIWDTLSIGDPVTVLT